MTTPLQPASAAPFGAVLPPSVDNGRAQILYQLSLSRDAQSGFEPLTPQQVKDLTDLGLQAGKSTEQINKDIAAVNAQRAWNATTMFPPPSGPPSKGF